jgi:hypothetical protein
MYRHETHMRCVRAAEDFEFADTGVRSAVKAATLCLVENQSEQAQNDFGQRISGLNAVQHI